MKVNYTSERNVQMLVMLMKEHGIRKVVASPGTTNITFVATIQHDDFFEVYSAADERSAAYIACGLAAESGEPVALSCTGATASRNYLPGLTEAYYRKLPVLAITSTQHRGRIGQHIPQVIDRTDTIKDTVKLSVTIDRVFDREDGWANVVAINKALLELTHRGGGPVHIDLVTTYSKDFSVNEKDLMPVNVIRRVCIGDKFPDIKAEKVAIYVGSHNQWDDESTKYVERFCEKFNGVVLCDHTSNYKGKYKIYPSIIASQEKLDDDIIKPDLMIHIGEISGSYWKIKPKTVWRVNPDGEIRDTFRRLKYVFEMEEKQFFQRYVENGNHGVSPMYYDKWKQMHDELMSRIPELPFSNLWIAQQTMSKLPENASLHLGILNSLRSWNYFEASQSNLGYCNVGGFGIDGNVSSLIGASLANPNKLYFGVVGDLAFFYDMNSLGNRYVGNNLRLMLINNGCGTEFKNYNHFAAQFGEEADAYIAARGHYGRQSRDLVCHYAKDLGFEYLTASSKEEYMQVMERFATSDILEGPIILEVFTDSKLESDALEMIRGIF